MDEKLKQVCSRVYASDPAQFRKLIVWVKLQERAKVPLEVITDSLCALESVLPLTAPWWPYLEAIVKRKRTEYLQAEAGHHKKYQPGSFGAILANLIKKELGQ